MMTNASSYGSSASELRLAQQRPGLTNCYSGGSLASETSDSVHPVFRLAVSGSRAIDDRSFVWSTLDAVAINVLSDGRQLELHLGDAAGVDLLALEWCRTRNIDRIIYFADRRGYETWQRTRELVPMPAEGGTLVADWQDDGPKAGGFRNHAMIRGCNLLLAVWNSTSSGTLQALRTAESLFVRSETHLWPAGTVVWSENDRGSVGSGSTVGK